MLCLSVCLAFYCPHYLPPTLGGQVGNKEKDRQANRAFNFKEEAILCCNLKKLLPCLMSGVTFHFDPPNQSTLPQ